MKGLVLKNEDLVFGKNGQVARELRKHADVIALGREDADLSNPDACALAIRNNRPNIVINAAAFTGVDQAEVEEDLALQINANAPLAMAEVANELDIPFIHISTDYVFSGKGNAPWKPSDATFPLGAYGRTKLAGEAGVRKSGATHAILRTSWVFSAHGNNFVRTMLRLAAERDRLSIVSDQIGGPTAASDIANACLNIGKQLVEAPESAGTYHFAGSPTVSWADFAREIFKKASLSVDVVNITSSEYPTPAERPKNSRMDCSGLGEFNISQPQWKSALDDILKDIGVVK